MKRMMIASALALAMLVPAVAPSVAATIGWEEAAAAAVALATNDPDPDALARSVKEAHEDAVSTVETWVPDEEGIFDGWATASLITPIGGQTVSGEVVLHGIASARKGFTLHDVGIFVDDQWLGSVTGETWSFTLDTRELLDGSHRLRYAAYATPTATEMAPRVGWGGAVFFSSLNDVTGVVVHRFEASVSGAASDVWNARLDESLKGVRVTFASVAADGAAVPLAGHALVTYKELPTEDATPEDPPLRTWHAQYGLIEGAAMVVQPPYGVFRAPGVLTVTAAFVGEGDGKVLIEALPMAPPPEVTEPEA